MPRSEEDVLWQDGWTQRRLGVPLLINSRVIVCSLAHGHFRVHISTTPTQVITLQLAITGIRTFYQSDRYNMFRRVGHE
jgi:hypothetical protein